MQKLFIGLDFGSDSVRALLVDAQGKELASAVHNYRRWSEGRYCNAGCGQFRQHPLDYLDGMEDVLKRVLRYADSRNVAGISVDTTASTPCAVDKSGMPLAMYNAFADDPDAMFVLWKDHTAVAEEQRINEVAENWPVDYRKYSGGSYSCEWFWSKVLHVLRRNPAVRNTAYSFVEHCDWITGVLTGCGDPHTMLRSRCTAGHKAMWHPEWGGLPGEDFLTAIDPLLAGLRSRLYCDSFPGGTPAGRLCPEWAEKLHLSENTVIGLGAIDCHVGAVGAAITPGELIKVAGTSTCDILAAPDPGICIPGICGQVIGSVLPDLVGFEAGQSAFGDVYNWFRRFLSYAGEVDFRQLEADAAVLPIGSTGVLALDWFNGRRTPYANSLLQGAIGNLNLGTTAPGVYRALVESTVMGSKAIFDHFKQYGVEIKGVTAVGGISGKSEFIMQMLADTLNMPIKIAATGQACALGAAMLAAAAAGTYPTVAAASQAMNSSWNKVYEPIQANTALYQQVYERYLASGQAWEELQSKLVNL